MTGHAAGRNEDPLTADRERFKAYVASFGIFQSPAEGARYVEEHFARFRRTLEKIPDGRGRLLEIGAAPFCMTLMLQRSRGFEIRLLNYGSQDDEVTLASPEFGERHRFPCHGTNVERDPFPYGDAEFDVVVCAELIEHLTFYPSHMLCEIHRVLKRDGCLVLTTPNLLRLFYKRGNAARLLRGHNLYDPYSGYGPYGRHNREFTPQELTLLVEGCGFSVRSLEVVDVDADSAQGGWGDRLFRLFLAAACRLDRGMLERFHGSQIILTARPDGERRAFLPEALYKSVHALEEAQRVFPRIP